MNRKDSGGNNIFEGGFLGLDNIGVFDRSAPLPMGGFIEQSDGTSWMAMFCLNMLKISLELAAEVDPIYEDIASKFFEHFLYISVAMNGMGGAGLWDETDGFFYDRLNVRGSSTPMKLRSMVGLIPLFAVDTIEPKVIERLPSFRRRMEWFIKHRPDLCCNIASLSREGKESAALAKPARAFKVDARARKDARRVGVPFAARNPSPLQVSRSAPVRAFLRRTGLPRALRAPRSATTGLFGGNSNWRGPIWFPVNYLLIESLQKYSYYFGEDLQVEGSPQAPERHINLHEVAAEDLPSPIANLLERRDRPPPGLGWNGEVPDRSKLPRPHLVLRILPRRQRSRHWRKPPNRLDRARREALTAKRRMIRAQLAKMS